MRLIFIIINNSLLILTMLGISWILHINTFVYNLWWEKKLKKDNTKIPNQSGNKEFRLNFKEKGNIP
jgi:hypothetical protein